MKSESTFDFHIRWARARISRLYNQQAAEYGGTMSIGYVLLNIDMNNEGKAEMERNMALNEAILDSVCHKQHLQKK